MLTWIREKFGTVVIGGIIGFIAFVFVFYGVFNPKSTRGLHEGAVAGTVNGDPISIPEFNREYTRRVEFFKNMGGGKLTEEQLKMFRIKEGVFQELARKKLMLQEAQRQGVVASDDEVKDKIQEIPAFQKDGHFDFTAYKSVLESNNYTPAGFERLVREDLSAQTWQDYFRSRVRVSDEEVRRHFLTSEDKRNIKYVLLTSEAGRKGIKVDPAEVKKFYEDKSKENLARAQFDAKKDREYKGKKFEDVKELLAMDILASDKTAEIRKINDQLAAQVMAAMTASKASDAKIDALLKSFGAEVKTTGLVASGAPLPGIGEAPELMRDAFAPKSPINAADGGKPKKYQSAAWTLVALVTETQKPDLAKLDTERDKIIKQLEYKKQHELFEAWLRKIAEKAKIDTNPSVVGDAAES